MVIAFEIPPLPKFLSRFGIECRGSVRTEVNEYAPALNDRSGCGIAVHRVTELWFFIFENQSFVKHFARFKI